MKKFFLATAIVACSMFFTSCDDGKPHCWTITAKGSCDGEVVDNETINYWGTAEEANAMITLAEQAAKSEGCNVKISKKKNKLSESDCDSDWY